MSTKLVLTFSATLVLSCVIQVKMFERIVVAINYPMVGYRHKIRNTSPNKSSKYCIQGVLWTYFVPHCS